MSLMLSTCVSQLPSSSIAKIKSTPTNAVHVKNISSQASEKTVTDFFGFCGKITSITLLKHEDQQEQEAIVEFQDANASKTAILLSNAMIVDRPITVSYYQPEAIELEKAPEKEALVTSVKTESEIENKPFLPPASERSNTSVIASLLAAGYVLGSDAIQKARDYDEQHLISTSIKEQAEAFKGKVTELDESLGISTTASAWATSASNFFGETASMLRRNSTTLVRSVGESEAVKSTSATLVGVKDAVVEVAGSIKEEASKLMEEPAIKSYVKVMTEKLYEGTEVVKGVAEGVAEGVEKGVKGVADETTRLISSNMGSTPQAKSEDDEALLVVLEDEEKRGAAPETVNPPDEPKKE